MATVVDALVVTLGLDPAAFTKGQKQAADALLKTRQSAVKEGRQIERSIDSAGEAIERLARNALKLFAIFTGGRAIGTFVTDIGKADAAMGRMADRLGVAPGQIAAFDNAVKRIGGSAGEGAASFQRLSDTINELRTTGNSSALPAFARLQGISGQQIRLNGRLEESFGDLAEAAKGTAERAGSSTASFLLRQAGYSEATINLLLQGRAAVEKALSKSARSGLVTKADADAARALGEQYEDLSDKITDFGRKISTALTPVLVDLMKRFGEWVDQNKEWLKTEIVGRVEEFARALREIPWDDVGKGIKSFISAVNDAAQSMGGWKTVAEIFFGLWAASKVAAVLAQIGLIRAALVVGDTSLLAAMARVGLPVAIGAAAMGHGFQTPEQAAKDPDQAILQKEGIDRRDRVRGWIGERYDDVRRFGRRLFGGASAEAGEARGGEGIRRRGRRSERATDEGRLNARAPEGAGKYRPEYKVTEADLSQRTADIIAGEAIRKNPESIDAVINNMMNRVGSKGWGPSGNLQQVATAPGQYEAAWRGSKASPSETEFIRSRIKAIASGGVPDNTNGANSYRAESYFRGAGRNKTWARTLGVNGTVVGGNRFTYDPSASNGPYAPYAKPKDVPDPQREKDLQTIRDATSGARKPDVLADPKDERRRSDGVASGASKPDVLADPKDERRKPASALLYGTTPPAARANAASVVSQTQSAQVDRMASISNDNRASSTTSNEAHFHGDMVFQNAGDSREIASNLRARLKEPQFVQAVNYGQA
ncbi:cell wall hydrolase [Methylobacterium organophilum]|uniref:cell wall hydrolase n=1 Tax=Methylobacterium organophilum TaxID=410 RepID=UPI0019D29F23|nr:cell wall hydrolase [Methylobacterium organophilum]MBN6824306.1 cell wall hydrolase [Methylobacterium organophilum]